MVDVSVLDVRLHGTKIGTITHIQDSISVLKFVSCGQSGKRRRGRGGWGLPNNLEWFQL